MSHAEVDSAGAVAIGESTAAPLADWQQPRWAEIPRCFSVRTVDFGDARAVGRRRTIRPGDIVLAEVVRVGQHKRLQLDTGRYRTLYVGDLFVAAAGCRYAVDQFEGRGEIQSGEPCALLAGGGVIGVLEQQHDAMGAPTTVRVVGVVEDAAGKRLTMARYGRHPGSERPNRVIAVVGSGMNAGKTTAAAALVRGLHASGLRVGAIKATGTGSFGDLQAYQDAGAHWVGDFALTGMASTYRQPVDRLISSLDSLLAMSRDEGCDAAVIELADGILQPETRALLTDSRLRRSVDGVLYAAADALSGIGGLEQLDRWGWRPMAVTGLITRAPLAVRELQAVRATEVWGRDELADPAIANRFTVRLELAEIEH